MLNVYVTSSERKSGKSYISAGLAATMQSLGYSTSYYKPIQTAGIDINGFAQSPDVTFIKSVDPYINAHFTYLFRSEFDPLISSEIENKQIDLDYIYNEYKRISSISETTIIDGDGGILSPIATSCTNIDLIKKLSIPVLIVTTPSINAVNSTLLTINAAQERGVDIRGVIVNNIPEKCSKTLLTSIPRVIEEYTNVKVLGLVSKLSSKLTPEDLIISILNGIDIESIFKVKIEKLDMN